jgi:hypothetical protein
MPKKNSTMDRTTEVVAWLEDQCAMPFQRGPKCGFMMAGTFATKGERSWPMPLPICSSCDPVVGQFVAAA